MLDSNVWKNILLSAIRLFTQLVWVIIHFVLFFTVSFILVFGFGLFSRLEIFLVTLSVSVAIVVLPYWYRTRSYSWQGITRLICFMLLMQALIVFLVPRSSVVPQTLLERSGLVTVMTQRQCDLATLDQAVAVVWTDPARRPTGELVAGGMMYNFYRLEQKSWIPDNIHLVRTAMAFDATVYIYDDSYCPSVGLYVHEYTHLWQFAFTTEHYGFDVVAETLSVFRQQLTDPDVIYEYGGASGLVAARNRGLHFLDFNPEQQAEIVKDYYQATFAQIDYGEQYTELLTYYVDEMLAI